MQHAEVTKTASVRGGAVCLPDAIIPDSCPAIGIDPCLAGLFSKVLLPLPTPRVMIFRGQRERVAALYGIWPKQV
jgi:hypothetical protein